MKEKGKELPSYITSSHLKAIEHGVPLLISQRWTYCVQFMFTFIAITLILFLTINGAVGDIYFLVLIAITALITFSLSNAILVDGLLRLKTILYKPKYVNPARISQLWHPFGPKTNILVLFYRTRFLLPQISIIIVPIWLRHAENIKILLEYTQGPACIMRKPEHLA